MFVSCPICSKESHLYFHSKDYNRRISKESFKYYRCSECYLIFISSIPANLGDYYPLTYYPVPKDLSELKDASRVEQYKINMVKQFVNEGRLLEIGPGGGGFVYLAQKEGFEVEVIEMETSSCQFLSNTLGINAINDGDPCKALEKLEPYNVIVLWHVIEHLADPWRTLEAISEKIVPGGIFIIATPNPNSFQFSLLKKFWPHIDAPRHLTLIPAPLIINKMELLGFKTAVRTTNDPGGLGWNQFGWVHFFSNLSNLRLIKLASRLLGWIISMLMIPIERKEGKGCAYTLVFTKEESK